MANFKVTKLEHIGKYIIPIFDKYPLLITKQYNYERFKKAYYILINNNFSILEKNSKLNELKLLKADSSYISPIFKISLNELKKIENIEKTIFKISKILSKP
jgi:hypothetical protein